MNVAENPHLKVDLHEEMFSIDFNSSNRDKKYYTDLSFSFLTWRTIEQMLEGEI